MDEKPKELICNPPNVYACEGEVCVCLAPPPGPVMLCEVRIQYPSNDPAHPSLMPVGPWCDAAGVELAIAVALAKLLGKP